MSASRIVKTFPRHLTRNDGLTYSAVTFTAMLLVAFTTHLVAESYFPAEISAYAGQFSLVVGAFALMIAVRLSFRNSHRNEKNRMSFSQEVRSVVRGKLMGQLSLEDADSLRQGNRVHLYGYSVWMESKGTSTSLMTDKVMGSLYKGSY